MLIHNKTQLEIAFERNCKSIAEFSVINAVEIYDP
jgi:hypothetical protein